jgi:hypothetical protein
MKVELTREDLIALVKGTSPNYSVMEHPLIKANGTYSGGFKDEWNWNYSFDNSLTDDQLLEMYTICKSSWK